MLPQPQVQASAAGVAGVVTPHQLGRMRGSMHPAKLDCQGSFTCTLPEEAIDELLTSFAYKDSDQLVIILAGYERHESGGTCAI